MKVYLVMDHGCGFTTVAAAADCMYLAMRWRDDFIKDNEMDEEEAKQITIEVHDVMELSK